MSYRLVANLIRPTDLANALGESRQAINNWRVRDRVPPHKVLAVCRLLDFRVTPHQLAPDFYPHPDDGLPAALRCEQHRCHKTG